MVIIFFCELIYDFSAILPTIQSAATEPLLCYCVLYSLVLYYIYCIMVITLPLN